MTMDTVKKDCFAYKDNNILKACYCLDKLYCKEGECRFYRNDITIKEIERNIKEYTIAKEN